MKKIYWLFLSLFLILIIFIISFLYYKSFQNISFEQIGVYNTNEENLNGETYWFTLREPEGFFDITTLDNLGVDYSNVYFDYSKYTYVVTVGYELSSLSYSYSEMKNRKFIIFPKQFVGFVELKPQKNDNVYIYRIKKMDIDSDVHEPNRGVSFAE
jgi:hypothetical protein